MQRQEEEEEEEEEEEGEEVVEGFLGPLVSNQDRWEDLVKFPLFSTFQEWHCWWNVLISVIYFSEENLNG